MASDSENNTPWSREEDFGPETPRNHPIGIRYEHLSRPKDLSPLRPSSMLPGTIALPDGKVGCPSCHNLYAREEKLLAVPIRASELCFTCHDV
ncbi:MAG: hypothetical protein JSU63_02710 [Phycisphaerales bacterium]|nr:MAG: hypothetical protein JSU63_02710 [Phycisphaerales bacterium]